MEKIFIPEELFDKVTSVKYKFEATNYKFTAIAKNVPQIILSNLLDDLEKYFADSDGYFNRETEENLLKYLLFDEENPFSILQKTKFILESKEDDNEGDTYWFKFDEYDRPSSTSLKEAATRFDSISDASQHIGQYFRIEQA